MIDWVTAIIPLKHSEIIGDGEVLSLDSDGCKIWSSPKRKKIKGSYESIIQVSTQKSSAINFIDDNGKDNISYSFIRLDGNPIKFLQGHNVFGSSDLLGLIFNVLMRIISFLNVKPSSEELHNWKIGNYKLNRVDCTDMLDLRKNDYVNSFLYRMGSTGSYKHRGNSTTSGGTVYFGQKSTWFSVKLYNKFEELKKHKISSSLESRESIIEWSKGKLRIELVLRKRELEKIGLNFAKNWDNDFVDTILLEKYCSKERMKMTEKIKLNEELIRSLPRGIRNTYITWAGGMDAKSLCSRNTWYKHRKELLEYGVDISSPPPKNDKNNTVTFERTVQVPWDFNNNKPEWAEGTEALYVPNHLRVIK